MVPMELHKEQFALYSHLLIANCLPVCASISYTGSVTVSKQSRTNIAVQL